jgi:aryl-alcohol dehydrogenase-like predicted oxidoreductase
MHLAGARNPEQVLDNVKAAEFRLTEEELIRINAMIAKLRLETVI